MDEHVFKNPDLQSAHRTIEETLERLEGLIDWAEDEGYRAIALKLREASGPLASAYDAAEQYDTGELS